MSNTTISNRHSCLCTRASSHVDSNDNDYFDDDTYDETIAIHLAQLQLLLCDHPAHDDDDLLAIADDQLLLLLGHHQPPPKTNEENANHHLLLQNNIMPTIIWLANVACNFKSACEKCCWKREDAPASSTTSSNSNNNNATNATATNREIISQGNSAPLSSSSSSTPLLLFPCTPREFTSEEHRRFDALQRSYHAALQQQQQQQQILRIKNSMMTMYQLSPRLIVHDPRERSRMKHKLTSFLERRSRDMEDVLLRDLEREERNTRKTKERKEWKKQRLRLQKKKKAKEDEEAVVEIIEQSTTTTTTVVQSKNENEMKTNYNPQRTTKKKKKMQQPTTAIKQSSNDNGEEELLFNKHPSSSVAAVGAWCCDYCKSATFPTSFEEATQHEALCQQYHVETIKETNLEVEEEEEEEKESESSDGEGEIVKRILKNRSDRWPPSADWIPTSTNDVKIASSFSSSSSSSSSSVSGNEGSYRIDTDHPARVYPIDEMKQSHPVVGIGGGENNRSEVEHNSTTTRIGAQSSANSAASAAQLVAPATSDSTVSDSHDTIISSERIKGATLPVLVKKTTVSRQGKEVCDLQKEDGRPGNEKKPMNLLLSPASSSVDATVPLPLLDITQDLMKTVVIDYDNRVDDTALPVSCLNYDVEPEGLLDSTIRFGNVSNVVGPEDKDDDSISLIHRSSVTYQNKILTAQNNFLARQNQSLLSTNEELQCQLAAVKRQTVEAIQQVQLKAYIAETSLCATKDRATVLENLLVNIVMDIAADELLLVEEREVREAIATYSSMMISQKNHESATLPLSLQEKSTLKYGPSLRPPTAKDCDNNSSRDTISRLAASKDFWGWMFRNKTTYDGVT